MNRLDRRLSTLEAQRKAAPWQANGGMVLDALKAKHEGREPEPLVAELAAALVGDAFDPAMLHRHGFRYSLEAEQ